MDMQLDHIQTPFGSLAVRSHPGRGRRVVCLHGFTLHGGMFHELGERLDRPIAAPDLPGHGATEVLPVGLEPTLGALAAWLGAGELPVDILGYSQGGRIAIHLAATHPALLASLVMVSAGPGLDVASRQTRREADLVLAGRIETIGLDAFLDEWLTDPALKTGRPGDRALRSENTAGGLAAALRGLGQGALPEVDLAQVSVRTLWVAGEHDPRYAAIAADGARRSHGEVAIIPRSGHNVVADAPAELATMVTRFIDESRGGVSSGGGTRRPG